ncbi:MAG: hypothetical protein E7183_04265 [Erysipelotrichaceae bacterium]|nr:hypothetical protein [Erysipelotrichaceae bacterium]
MNDKKTKKLNDRKRRIHHEYEQGKDYFMETSMDNVIDPNKLYNNSFYQSFINNLSEPFLDESLNEKNSPKH